MIFNKNHNPQIPETNKITENIETPRPQTVMSYAPYL